MSGLRQAYLALRAPGIKKNPLCLTVSKEQPLAKETNTVKREIFELQYMQQQ